VSAVAAARTAARARMARASALLTAALCATFAVSVSVGDFPIPLQDVVPAILGSGDDGTVFVAQDLRLPRVVSGLLVGAAFGISGAIFQAVARNPLASPDILGIMAGASAAAVFAITVISAPFAGVALAAFGGAFAIAAAVYALAYQQGVSSYRFVLVGIGLGAVAVAITSYLMTRAEIFEAAEAFVWLTGSVNGAGWETAVPVAGTLAVLVPAALALASPLRMLQLGDDTARGLGVGVERSRLALLLVAVALAGVGTAAAGPIAFVAFLAAPIARRLTRAPLTLVPAALTGALLVVAADIAARRLFAPTEIPVGVFTGLCGAPYFLWLLGRRGG
jgi:iron complex transport system permease protein